MTRSEQRGLVFVVLILLGTGCLRLGLADRYRSDDFPRGPEAGDSLLSASAAALDDAQQRARPLGPDERIDPNRAPASELDRLPGVGPEMAGAIVAARDELGPFQAPDDLVWVRGIGPATVERLRPFLEVGRSGPVSRPPAREDRTPMGFGRGVGIGRGGVDLNSSDSRALQTVPGIGPALAQRILTSRKVDGPFRSAADLERVPGIGAVTARRIWDFIRAESSS